MITPAEPHQAVTTSAMVEEKRHGLIAACSWTVDRIKIVDSWPQEEHLAQIIATDQQGGGCGHNLAVDMRRLDNHLPVEAIGLVGTDADGQFLQRKVKDAGIDTSQFISIDGVQTSFTDVMSVASTGKRTFFHHPGSHDSITPEHFNLQLCHGRILHLGLLGVHAKMDAPWQQETNGWVTVLRQAQSLGIQTNLELVSVEPEKIRRIARPCLQYLNTLIVNEYELSALAESAIHNDQGQISIEKCTAAAARVLEYSQQAGSPLSMVVVHSPAFATALTAKGEVHTRNSFHVKETDVVSTVGAGDAFAAGMLYGIHEQWSIDQSLELAHATAAASLRSANTVGTVESVQHNLEFARAL